MSENLEATLTLAPEHRSSATEKSSFAYTAIILALCSTIAALVLCISTQGAPLIDLSNIAPP
jgi:hypothetical protein